MAEEKISFCASGYVTQRIEILDAELTVEQLVKMLNDGSAVTTIQETDENGVDSFIQETATGKDLAMIRDVDNNLEYTDFDTPVGIDFIVDPNWETSPE
tara:strand:- start:1681 stop:1977 length:297 start_codon:yes stop_codon:yes gene_type:complete